MRKKLFFLIVFVSAAAILYWQWSKSFVIVIDPGHGGDDPGAISVTGTYEKEIALALALEAGAALEKEGYDVRYTRTTDETVSLDERIQVANEAQADLVLSIHANTVEVGTDVRGVQLLYYPDEEGTNEATANRFLHLLIESLRTINQGAIERTDLAVLNGSTAQSFLIEAGFLTNPQEVRWLESESYQKRFGLSVARTVNALMKERVFVETRKSSTVRNEDDTMSE